MVTTAHFLLLCGGLLIFKHFLTDGPLQTEYQYSHKGQWGHLGGIIHTLLHALGTLAAFSLAFALLSFSLPFWYLLGFAGIFAVLDGIIHYLIDLTKVKITQKFAWAGYEQATIKGKTQKVYIVYNTKYFWAFVLDQCAHAFTYICLLALACKVVFNAG